MKIEPDPTSRPLSRAASGVVTVVLWGLVFGLVGGMLAVVVAQDAPERAPSFWLITASLVTRFAMFGILSGTLFWWITGLLFDHERITRFGRIPVFLFGAIGAAAFVPLFMQAMNLLSGDGLVAWGLVLDDSVWAFFFGGIAALGSLELARRRTRPSA